MTRSPEQKKLDDRAMGITEEVISQGPEQKADSERAEALEADNIRAITSASSWYIAGASSKEWLSEYLDELRVALESPEKTAEYVKKLNKSFLPGGENHLTERAKIEGLE